LISVLKAMTLLLADPGFGENLARAMPPGVALDLVAVAGDGRKPDRRRITVSGATRFGSGQNAGGCCVVRPRGWRA
jgi:hypothetical protein